MKTRHKFVIGGAVIFGVLAALSVQGLQEMTVYFYTPQEVLAAPNDFQEKPFESVLLFNQVLSNGMRVVFGWHFTSPKTPCAPFQWFMKV